MNLGSSGMVMVIWTIDLLESKVIIIGNIEKILALLLPLKKLAKKRQVETWPKFVL
jgi:hypothetical protein